MGRSKSNKKREINKALILTAGALLLISLIVIVSALSDNDKIALQDELNNLTSYMNDNDCGWLINYNLTYPTVNVYRENSNELLAQFPAVTAGANDSFSKYQVFLTGLGDNELYATFDLRSIGNVDYDYVRNAQSGIPEHPENPKQTQGFLDVVDPTVYGIPKGLNLLNNTLGTFEGISADGHVVRVIAVPHDVYLMKMRIDEIKKELNNYELKNG